MNRIMAMVAAICMLGANAAVSLPEWAAGSFKGQVRNWCNDSSFSVYGNASLSVASNGKVSGSINFSDGASGKPTGRFEVLDVSDSEVWITAGFKWYDEKGKADGTSWSDMTIRRTAAGVSMAFKDNDDAEEDWEDKCPVEGTLERNGAGSAIPEAWKKARTLVGVYGEGCGGFAEGVAQLKCGKANKKGIAKVSLTVTPFVGKKRSYKAVSVDVSGGGSVEVSWPQQSYAVTIDGDGFFGEPIYTGMRPACSPNAVWSADVGGAMSKAAWFDFGDIPIDMDAVQYEIASMDGDAKFDALAPVPVTMSKGKWICPKASKMAKVKLCAHATTASKCVQEWAVKSSGDAKNIPGLRLSYNAKTGVFKGSFSIYGYMGKKYAAKVTGLVVGGVGQGVATCPKLSADSWCVKVE